MKRLFVQLCSLTLLLAASLVSASEFYASHIAETEHDGSPALIVRFTAALAEDTRLSDYLTVTPEPNDRPSWITLDGGYSWTLPFVEPATKYTLTFEQGLTSKAGIPLKPWSTSANGSPVYKTHSVETAQLTPSVTFADTGLFLHGGSPSNLPITSVNVDAVELDVFRVRDDQLNLFLQSTFYQGRLDYYRLNQLKQYADLIHTARYDIELRRHQRAKQGLNIAPALAKFDNGVYVAVLRKPGNYEYRYDTTFFSQTQIGLSARFYNEEFRVWAHDLTTGAPIPNVDVEATWHSDTDTASSQTRPTGADGQVRFQSNRAPTLLLARHQSHLSFLRPGSHQLDLSGFDNVVTRHQELQAFFWGPRTLYRPGETATIQMLLRDYDGYKVSPRSLNLRIIDARGRAVVNTQWRADNNGHYRYELSLSDDAATGQWRVMLADSGAIQGSYAFQVEEFLPERLTMTLGDDQLADYHYVDGHRGEVAIQGDYLYGAPAAGNEFDAIISAKPATDLFKQWQDFSFGDPTLSVSPTSRKINRASLDDQGNGQLSLPTDWTEVTAPLELRVSASLYESGGRPITRNLTLTSFPNRVDSYFGVRPQFAGNPSSNTQVAFDLIHVNRDGQASEKTASVRLIRRLRYGRWFYDENSGWSRRWKTDSYVAYAETITIGETPTQLTVPVQWGDYELEVVSNGGAKTVFPFRTQYRWSTTETSSGRPDMLDLRLNQDHFAPGETAELSFESMSAGHGLVIVESSDQALQVTPVQIVSGENQVTLPISADWTRHDLYVTVLSLSPAEEADTLTPMRRIGQIHLPIRRNNATLDVSLEVPERTEPNQPVSANIRVNNPELSGPHPIYATVALVDMGVLNITREERPQPEQFFFGQRRFEGRHWDLYNYLIENLGITQLEQKFGGGFKASDDSLSRGGNKPQSDVRILSFFSETVRLENGEGSVRFDLPDFNGRAKWTVVVWSDYSYGSSEQETTIADPLVTQLAMPRFLAMGDESQVTLDLHNLSGETQALEAQLSITGDVASPFQKQTLTLEDQQKETLVIPVSATGFENPGVLALTVTSEQGLSIQREWQLGVRPAFPLITHQERKYLPQGERWQPTFDLSQFQPGSVQAQLTVSPKPAINFNSHFDALLRYPYGCLEQTTSSTLPWVLLDANAIEQLGMSQTFQKRFGKPFSDAFRREQIETGLNRLYQKQLSDGRFGYWDNTSWASNWGTIYATELIWRAQTLGIAVDQSRLEKAQNALASMVRGQNLHTGWSHDVDATNFNIRAYAAYLLSTMDRANVSDVRRLMNQMTTKNVSHSMLPWVHIGLAMRSAGAGREMSQAFERALAVNRERGRYYADYGTPVRDLTLSLTLLMENNQSAGLEIGPWLNQLENQLLQKRWFSTQERISLARLALQFATSGDSWQGTLVTTDFTQNLQQSAPFNTLLDGEQLTSLSEVSATGQDLFTSVAWQGVSTTPLTPSSEGLTLTRDYFDLDGQPLDLNNGLETGTTIVVRLRVKAVNDRVPEALLVDLLPAGLELENPNLKNAALDLSNLNIEGVQVADQIGKSVADYEEYRDDRFVAALKANTWQTTEIFYVARAVTPGRYQVPNALIEDMYRPDIRAVSESLGWLEVRAATPPEPINEE